MAPQRTAPEWTAERSTGPEWTSGQRAARRAADPWTARQSAVAPAADQRTAGQRTVAPAADPRTAGQRTGGQRTAAPAADPWTARQSAVPPRVVDDRTPCQVADRRAADLWTARQRPATPAADPGTGGGRTTGGRTTDRWPADRWPAEDWISAQRAPAAPQHALAEHAPVRQAAPAAPAPGADPPAGRRGVRHPVRLALYALVLFGLVAGSAAWLAVDKSVRLTVDGAGRTVSTYASTVGGVLDDAGVTVSDRDVLAPAREARISDGGEIVLRRGRLLRLTIDGKSREVWVTATTVQEALDQIGYRQSGLYVSATRSERLPLDGYDLTVRTPKTVTVLADGRRQRVVTTAATVGQALDEAGIRVDGDDKVSQLATAPVVNGMTVTITRVSRKTTTTRTVLTYDTVEKQDPDAAVGSRKVTTEGVNGLQQVTYVETYVNGRLTSRKVAKVTVLKQPVDEVVVVGPEPPPAQPAECADFPTTGGLNWCGLAKCESGLNPNAYNPAGPYYGLYQFDIGTWQANGGTGSPSGKSIAEQTRVAYNLYQARGRSPWPVCGQYL